jgi:hypothetical protein
MSIYLAEGRHAAEFVMDEANGNRSRDNIVVAAGLASLVGNVLVKTANAGAVTVGTPGFSGTGNGVLTKAGTPAAADVQAGTYRIQLVDEGANAGDFIVIRPDGTIDGTASVGVAYDGQVKFTIADGATDFASPAAFTLAVANPSATSLGTFSPLVAGQTVDSTDTVVIGLYPKLGADTDRGISVISRDATVNGKCLEWPVSQTATEKDAALAALTRAGIIVR